MTTSSNASSRVSTPFGATSTAREVVADVDLSGRRVVVTGGASGIGIETVRALAGAGAEGTIAARRVRAAAPVAAELRADTGSSAITVAPLDLGDPASVAAFVDTWSGPLHVLVNNAGVMAVQERTLVRGHELQFATNHLGHFQLAVGLHP